MSEGRGILVVGEVAGQNLSGITKELLAAARNLSRDLGDQEVATILMANDLGVIPQEALAAGADKVYTVEAPIFETVQPDAYLAVVEKIARENPPLIVLGGKDVLGQEVIPRLAFRLNTGVAQDCVGLSIDSSTKKLLATRPVYGGNAVAEFLCQTIPMVATVRARVFEALEPDTSRQGEVIKIDAGVDESAIRTRMIERVEEKSTGLQLKDASIVIGGGRGLGGPEPFHQLDELAGLLHAAVGASRAVCDAGWTPPHYQIGLTGKTITPELYITVAISGASQHMAGCSGSKNIVAINKDAEANIFKDSRYGAVGDWKKILPAFIEQVRELVK